jgi:rubrerythrin
MSDESFHFDLSTFSIDDAYKIAVVLEEEGYQFYNKIIEATDNARVKNEVKFLRDEEVRHKNFFQKQVKDKGSARDDEKLRTFIQKEFIDPTAEYFDGDKIAVPSDALRFGAILEQKSIAFYKGMKDQESGEESIAEIDKIIEEEQKHLKKIYIILSY